MATGGQRIHLSSTAEYAEYNAKLYKAVLPLFVSCIDAVQLSDCPEISCKLTREEMQVVKKTYDGKGHNTAARELLDYLERKPDWFDALVEALKSKDLKMQGHLGKFKDAKDKVDREWIQGHPAPPHINVCNPSVPFPFGLPTQSSEGDAQFGMQVDRPTAGVPAAATGGVPVPSDFTLPLPASTGLQTDAAMESMEHETAESPSESAPPPSNIQEGDGTEEDMLMQSEEVAGGNEEYAECSSTPIAASSHYEALQKNDDNNDEMEYTELTDICLERDACPMPEQVSEVPEQEVGVEAEPQILAPQQVRQRRRARPQRREDHPSLCQAISRDPQKDFEAHHVIQELSTLQGWSNRQEEHKVIQLIRPHQNTNGYYVIWFWSLAKRPTICVAQGGRVITFVVHKSTSRPTTFYLNRQQKKCASLRELLQFHCTHGIQYSPQGGGATTVLLTHPYTRA